MTGIVVTGTPRTPLDLVDRLSGFGVATVHEAQGRAGLLSGDIASRQQNVRVAGNAVTVTVAPGDNTMIGVAVEQCQEGDILVVAPTSPCDMGFFGDLLATSLQARGVRGLITETGVRDLLDLREMGFPVWSKHVSAEGTRKGALGDVNVAISVGGRIVNAGDVIVADEDGVVVVPRADAQKVADASQAREEKEAAARARYLAGEIALDVNNMRPMLEKAGIRYIDFAEWDQENAR